LHQFCEKPLHIIFKAATKSNFIERQTNICCTLYFLQRNSNLPYSNALENGESGMRGRGRVAMALFSLVSFKSYCAGATYRIKCESTRICCSRSAVIASCQPFPSSPVPGCCRNVALKTEPIRSVSAAGNRVSYRRTASSRWDNDVLSRSQTCTRRSSSLK